MNSCMSMLLFACAPPLITFISGTGSCHFAGAAEIAVQRQRRFVSRRLRHRAGDGEHRVGAEPRLVVGAVEIDHRRDR